MKETAKRPLGRPKKFSGRRPTWTIRLDQEAGAEVKEIAERTGRSISEVCEQLITRQLRIQREDMLVIARKDFATIIRETIDAYQAALDARDTKSAQASTNFWDALSGRKPEGDQQ